MDYQVVMEWFSNMSWADWARLLWWPLYVVCVVVLIKDDPYLLLDSRQNMVDDWEPGWNEDSDGIWKEEDEDS